MQKFAQVVGALASILLLFGSQDADAGFQGLPRGLKAQLERIKFNEPVLAPMAYVRFCIDYANECESKKAPVAAEAVALTAERKAELVEINTRVNRSIRPQPNLGGIATEKWVIDPEAGDCNDYAVTKRHLLMARGWPSDALLLAEVVLRSGEHHLVVVVRTKDGDFVLDSLDPNIRHWSQAPYSWVRMQTPENPNFWAKIGPSLTLAKGGA